MNKICERNICTGCGLCANICPTHAITMEEYENSFIFPKIDQKLCINCGICFNKCPSNLKKSYSDNEFKQECYACWSKNKTTRKKSTSGGIFSELCKEIINQNGYIAGVIWSQYFEPEFILTNDLKMVDKMRGSKYAQARTNNIYNQVKEKLDAGFKVLFCGTPCQVSALRSIVGNKYPNLVIVDFVCHGVPPAKMFQEYLKSFNRGLPNSVYLREKRPHWDYSNVTIRFSDFEYVNLTIDDPYYNLFNFGYSLRHVCHNCIYTKVERNSDITMADFWGFAPKNFKTRSYNKGVSLMLVNSKIGMTLFNTVKHNIFHETRDVKESVAGNKCFSEPFTLDENIEKEFWHDYSINKLSFTELETKYISKKYGIPKDIWLRRIKNKYRWLFRI